MCITALTITNKYTHETGVVPCGKCPQCRARRASAWSFRLRQQEKISQSSYFITLTYDTLTVPISKKNRMELCKRDVQLFIKRLRKAHTQQRNKIKYYAVGEYGSTTYRPHYHIIIFDIQLNKLLLHSDILKLELTGYDGKVELNSKLWPAGHLTIGRCTPASIGYCLKYISKPKTVPQYKGDDRQPEFSLMSKGLGANYLTKDMQKWHTADLENRMYCNLEDGIKISMPRYYKDKLYNNEQREKISKAFYEKFTKEIIANFHSADYQKHAAEKIQAINAAFRWNKLTQKKETL